MSDRGRSPAGSAAGASPQSRQPSMSASGRSRAASPAQTSGSGDPKTGWAPGMGFDPAKPPSKERRGNTRMELPPDAYLSNEDRKDVFAIRGNKFNTEGRAEKVEVNQFRMTKFDFGKKIYQYDVSKVGSRLLKRLSLTRLNRSSFLLSRRNVDR
jgi:eukaryotic translation initiation factor 2C